MHEFEADGAAIGSPQNLEHLGNGGILEPKHAIDEDLPCVVGFRESIGRRMQLLMVFRRLETKRIEIGVQMAAHAIGADHHQRVDRIAGGAQKIVLGKPDALTGFPLELGADMRLDFRPIAVERRNEFVRAHNRPATLFPARPLRRRRNRGAVVGNLREEVPPGGVERRWIAQIAILELLDIGGVAAIQKRRPREGRVRHRAATHGAARTIGTSIRIPARHHHLLRD